MTKQTNMNASEIFNNIRARQERSRIATDLRVLSTTLKDRVEGSFKRLELGYEDTRRYLSLVREAKVGVELLRDLDDYGVADAAKHVISDLKKAHRELTELTELNI